MHLKKNEKELTKEEIKNVFITNNNTSNKNIILSLFNKNQGIFPRLKNSYLKLSNPNLLIDKPLDNKNVALFYRLSNYIKNPEINCKYIAFPFGIPGHETVALFDFEKAINIIIEELLKKQGNEELRNIFSKNPNYLNNIDIQTILSSNIYYFDSSTYNCEKIENSNELRPKSKYFQKLNCSLIRVLNKNIQINGTCSHWSMCFLSVLSEDQMKRPDERKYDNIEKIKKAFENGSIQLDICIKMGDIFGETIKYYRNGNEQPMGDDNGYLPIKLKINNQPEEFAWYGINKQCHRNRFVDIENLINSLGGLDEGKKEELKEQFQFHIKYQKINKQLNKFYDYNDKYRRSDIVIKKLKYDNILKSQKDAESFKNNFGQFLNKNSKQIKEMKESIDMFAKRIDEIGIVDDNSKIPEYKNVFEKSENLYKSFENNEERKQKIAECNNKESGEERKTLVAKINKELYDFFCDNYYLVKLEELNCIISKNNEINATSNRNKCSEVNPGFLLAQHYSRLLSYKLELSNIKPPEVLNNYGYANTIQTNDIRYGYFETKDKHQPEQTNPNPPADLKSIKAHSSQPSVLAKPLLTPNPPENKKPSSQSMPFLEREEIRRKEKQKANNESKGLC